MTQSAAPAWNLAAMLAAPAFATLAPLLRQLPRDRFPTIEDLNRLRAGRTLQSGGGAPLVFVAQESTGGEPYESRIYTRGEVPTRRDNWHDLFNALVWLAFPRSKAALNRHHERELRARRGARERGTPRDVLTLFDEGGIVVETGMPELGVLLREFRWKELFWQRRDEVRTAMRFHLFGHSIYEKLLTPYKGITAKSVIFDAPAQVADLSPELRLEALDAQLAGYFDDAAVLSETRAYAPLPVLGIPGWTAQNADARYYDDTTHFRPGRADSGRAHAGC